MENQDSNNEYYLKGKPASKEAKAWHEYGLKSQQEIPNRLEDAAKFLSGMISISLTIFVRTSPSFINSLNPDLQIIIIIIWFLSLLSALIVLFPFKYSFRHDSENSIKQAHNRIVKWKRIWLNISVIMFIIAILGMLGIYLFNNL